MEVKTIDNKDKDLPGSALEQDIAISVDKSTLTETKTRKRVINDTQLATRRTAGSNPARF
jgi:hypothetical protein